VPFDLNDPTERSNLKWLKDEEKRRGEKDPIKIVILGDPSVGKTCLLIRYVAGKFPDSSIPNVLTPYWRISSWREEG